jgi:23S rRNA (uracil1939-C5)-methyltransferase
VGVSVIRLGIESLAAGGDGVGRVRGKVCFVPFTAPGDEIAATVVREARDFIRAILGEVERPGPARREPCCPLHGRCGGCSWLHVDEAAQVEAKSRFLGRAIGRDACEIRAAIRPLGYRRVARLHFEPGRRCAPSLGFFAAAGREVVALERCPVLDPAMERALGPIRDALLAPIGAPVELRLVAAAPGVAVTVDSPGPLPAAFYAAAEELVPGSLAAVAARVDGVTTHVAGPSCVAVEGGDGAPLLVPSSSFGQAHAEVNRALASAVAGWAAELGCRRGLELHSGAGNLTTVLAPHVGSLAAVELDRLACAAARENLAARGLGRVEVLCGDAIAAYDRLGARADIVVMDPPRTGSAELARRLAGGGHRAVIYVSCDPATLRRDLGHLAAGGWAVARCVGFDMFPQTAHLEAAVLLERP